MNCFDYYDFGSVQVDASPTVSSTVSGVPLTFSGTIANENAYPVVDGSVYVKVFRKTTDGETHRNGYPVVDEFFVKDGVAVPASSSVPISFEWNVPRYLPAGDYEADFYFMTGKRFNLLGLSFTDDVTGNKAPFSVSGDAPAMPAFDKDAVTLNGESFAFAAFPPHFGKDVPVNADVVLVNPGASAQTVNLDWSLYNWSGEREENMLDKKSETVTLAPNERKSLRYVADPAKSAGSVTFLRAESFFKDTKSILNIRFVRDGIDEVRINFPSIMKYPIREGESNTLFSCLHSTNSEVVKNGELTLTLADASGNTLDTYTYKGDITGAMMGVKSDFTPKISSSTFKLKAELKKDGTTVETYETTYSCRDIDPSLCPMNGVAKTSDTASVSSPFGTVRTILFALFLAVPLGLVLWLLLCRRGRGPGAAAVLLLFGVSLLLAPHGAEAKSVTWSGTVFGWLAYYWDWDAVGSGIAGGWGAGLQNPAVSVSYGASVLDVNKGVVISDGATVPVGTKIKIVPKTYEDTDVSWFGTGYSGDSPYGHWKSGSSAPNSNITCDSSDYVTHYLDQWKPLFQDTKTAYFDVYIPFSIAPPAPSYAFNGSAGLDCAGDTCTVTGPGAILATINFPDTSGKFYYRYYDYRSDSSVNNRPAGCYGNNVPMRYALSCDPSANGYANTSKCTGQDSSDFILSVPVQAISFSLTAVPASNPPTASVVSGPTTGFTSTSYDFSAVSTDPDGDQLRYGFDWNLDGSVDQWMPGSGYVASGSSQTASYSWITIGAKTFQVLAEDSNGVRSGWTSHDMAVTDGNLRLCMNGAELSDITLAFGDARNLRTYYDTGSGCSGTDVAASTTFAKSSGADAVTLSGNGTSSVSITAKNPDTGAGKQTASETLSATYSGQSKNLNVTVSEVCTLDCSSVAGQYCSNESWDMNDSCGVSQECVNAGTRSCEFNWKEVAPGE